MLKNLIVLSDGTRLFSGENETNAIQSVKLTQSVNEGTKLTLGSTCASQLRIDLITPNGALHIQPGTELTLYKVSDQDTQMWIGVFVVERAFRPSANHYVIEAYDKARLLNVDLTQWLNNLDGWPYSLYDFAKKVCRACNLNMVNLEIPNGDWQVSQFFASGVTGKRLMQWIGQACGRFCRATPEGEIEFAWYRPTDFTVTPNGQQYYFLDSLNADDHQIAPIDNVQILQTDREWSVVCGTGSNSYIIKNNPLLRTETPELLQPVAQSLYEILRNVTYTPCKVSVQITTLVNAGDIIHLTDVNGRMFTTYVLSKIQEGQKDTLISMK